MSTKRRNVLTLQEKMEIVYKLDKLETDTSTAIARIKDEYKISNQTIRKIILNANKIKELANKEINLTKKLIRPQKYGQLEYKLLKLYREMKKKSKLKKFNEHLFMTKGMQLMSKLDPSGPLGSLTFRGKKSLLNRCLKLFKNQEEFTNYKSPNLSENSQSLDFSKQPFKTKGTHLMPEVGESSKDEGKKKFLRRYMNSLKNQQESTNYKSPNSSKISQNLARDTDKTKQELVIVENFIRDFNYQLREENIKRDNIYIMNRVYLRFKTYFQHANFQHQDENEIDIEKLKNDRLYIVFCTNATGSHKLPPFYIYEYEDEEVKKYLKNKENVIFKKKEDEWKSEIMANWYNNVFIKLVGNHHRKTSGKVILLIKYDVEFISLENIITMQNDKEILFLPYGAFEILQPLIPLYMTGKINKNLRKEFKNFLTSCDLEICTKVIYNTWARILPTDIQHGWENLLQSDFRTEGNANSTSLVEAKG